MKTLIISILIFFCNYKMFSQEEVLRWSQFEIFMMTTKLPLYDTIRYKMDAVGAVWHTTNFVNYYTTTAYNVAYYPPLSRPPTWNSYWNDISTLLDSTFGFNFIPVGSFYDYGNYTYGLYRVNSNYSEQYFYLDYRDDRYPLSEPPYISAPGGNDIWVLYKKTNNKFYYSPTEMTDSSSLNWITINKGDYLNIWQIKGVGAPTTSRFPNFWQNCLSLVDNGSSCPRLIWGAYPNPNVTGYNIYRTIRTFRDPPYGQFQKIASVSSSTFSFIDLDYSIGSGWYGFYKVTAKDGTVESEYTNIAMTTIDAFGKEVSLNNSRIMNSDYTTVSTYPNPFNPTTTIKYKLVESGNVRLVVTNSLGEEVKMFEEGLKEAGEYSCSI